MTSVNVPKKKVGSFESRNSVPLLSLILKVSLIVELRNVGMMGGGRLSSSCGILDTSSLMIFIWIEIYLNGPTDDGL